jgi:hypothetical protein
MVRIRDGRKCDVSLISTVAIELTGFLSVCTLINKNKIWVKLLLLLSFVVVIAVFTVPLHLSDCREVLLVTSRFLVGGFRLREIFGYDFAQYAFGRTTIGTLFNSW